MQPPAHKCGSRAGKVWDLGLMTWQSHLENWDKPCLTEFMKVKFLLLALELYLSYIHQVLNKYLLNEHPSKFTSLPFHYRGRPGTSCGDKPGSAHL